MQQENKEECIHDWRQDKTVEGYINCVACGLNKKLEQISSPQNKEEYVAHDVKLYEPAEKGKWKEFKPPTIVKLTEEENEQVRETIKREYENHVAPQTPDSWIVDSEKGKE